MLDRLTSSLSPGTRLLALNVGLALAYYLTAALSMAMAIGPMRITALWPPAGIALAAFMLAGPRALPGLALGSVITHYVDFFGPKLGWGVAALLGSALLASGSLVQAALAAHLARQVPQRLEGQPVRQTVYFALLACACCLISASVGQATLQAFGTTELRDSFFAWLTWWVGDASGMLIVAPIALLAWHPVFRRQRVAAQAFPIICLGLGLTLFSTLSIGVVERDMHIERFRAEGTRLALTLQNHIDMAERDLEILQRAFYRVELQADEFRAVTGPMLVRSPWQQHFAYLPHVSADERYGFEFLNGDISLREVSPRDTVVAAAQRQEYFPVLWTDPEAGYQALVGVDHLADLQRRAAILRARESGHIAASLPLHSLAQTASNDLVQMLYAPLSIVNTSTRTMTRPPIGGMVASTIDVGQLARAALAQMDIESHNLLLHDPEAPGAPSLYWPAHSDPQVLNQAERERVLPVLRGGIHHSVPLHVADRHWMLVMQPAWAQLAPKPGWLQLAVLLSGLTFTALLTGFMVARSRHDLLVQDQQQALETQVRERTQALAESNESLRDEVAVRQRAEQELKMFRWLAESAHQGFAISELDGRVIYLNSEMRALTGDHDWTPGTRRNLVDYLGKRLGQVFTDEVMPALRERGIWEGEWRIPARNGRPARALTQSHFVLKDDFGQPLYMASLVTDVTQQRQVEDELREAQARAEAANRAKSMFLANMSHEIRTPLNAVLGFTQILLADRSVPAQAHQRLEVILSAGNRLLNLINDVLDLAKIESGKLNLVPQNFDVRRELVDIDRLFAGRVAAKGLAWQADLAGLPAPSVVHGDRTKIGQVVINLLGNALKFTEHGHVKLQAWRDGDALWVEVQDSGPGMNADELEQLFAPFSQGEAGRIKGGTGLGLVLSRDIVRAMGGELTLASTPGIGTRARVTLPLPVVDAEPSVPVAEMQLARLDPATPCRALVVEDDPDSRDLLVRLLKDVGCQVQQAEDGQAGLEACRANTFDVVFSDIRMPRLSGVDMIHALRAEPATAALPVVAVTASSLEHERRFYIEIGFQDFVPKPYPFRDIYRMLAEHGGVRFLSDEQAAEAAPLPTAHTDGPEVLSAPDEATLARLCELRAAAADGDLAQVKNLMAGLPSSVLGSARRKAWEDAARRYDFQGLEDGVREFLARD